MVVSQLATKALEIAAAEVGVRETSPNRGQRVDQYHLYSGRDPAQADSWCAQFVRWVYGHAAEALGVPCPVPKTSSVLGLWQRSPLSCRVLDPQPGDVFLIDHGKGKGHTGIVVATAGATLATIEGNTSAGGSRNGDGVYQRTRDVEEITLGFLRFT